MRVFAQAAFIEPNRQEERRCDHQQDVDNHLLFEASEPVEAIGVEVARKEHELEEENGRSPHRGRPSKEREQHLSDHRLEAKQQKCAEHHGGDQQEPEPGRKLWHAA
jgi:hypothetical protein